eukprot:6028370-Amphidinium_carterae.2
MNKELSLELAEWINKNSFEEIDSKTLTPQQLQKNSGYKMGDYTTANQQWYKDTKCKYCGKGFSKFVHDMDTQTFAATPGSMAMRLLLTIAILTQFTIFTTDVASAFLNTPIEQDVLVQPPKEYYHNNPHTILTKALYGLKTSPEQLPEHLSTILQQLGFRRLKSDACAFANKQSLIYLMTYVDDLLVVGYNATT